MEVKGRKPSLATIQKRQAVPYTGPVPECPEWLDEEAKIEWDRVVPEMVTIGVFIPSDSMLLASYCQAYSQWMKAELQVRDDGLMISGPNGNSVLHPCARHAIKLLAEVRRAAAEFGFSPASRTRVDASPKQQGKEEDAFEQFNKG